MSTGGTSIDRTDEAHPDNVEIAETAARVVGLDVAGIDFITPDIASPVRERGGGDRRGQRRARLPDAHQPDRGRAAVRRQARPRHALSAGLQRAHPDRGGDRHQRQDDDRADDRPHPQADGPARGHDHHRRHRHRRPAHPEGRHERAPIGADGAAEPDRSTPRCSRSRAAASCARASATTATTSPWSPTSRPTTWACAASTRWASWPRQVGARRGGAALQARPS